MFYFDKIIVGNCIFDTPTLNKTFSLDPLSTEIKIQIPPTDALVQSHTGMICVHKN